jgi:hypothetical protein
MSRLDINKIEDDLITGLTVQIFDATRLESIDIDIYIGNNFMRTIKAYYSFSIDDYKHRDSDIYKANFEPIAKCACKYNLVSFRIGIDYDNKININSQKLDPKIVEKMLSGQMINIETGELYSNQMVTKFDKSNLKNTEKIYQSFHKVLPIIV